LANVQHSALTDPNIHEPKGVASAASGKVYVANGSGSGTWKHISGHAYGELYISGGVTAQTLPASSATAKLNPTGEWTTNGSANVTLSAANGTITISQAGEYQLNFWASFATAGIASGAEYNFHYAVNGTPSPRKIKVSKNTSGIDKLNVCAIGYAQLAAGDVVSIYVGGDGTSSGTNITVTEAGFSLLLVDAA